MSDESQPQKSPTISLSQVVIDKRKLAIDTLMPVIKPHTERKQARSTYTEANMKQFKDDPIDKIIASKFSEDRLIPWGSLDVSRKTLMVKCTDAIKWLADHEKDPNGPYHTFKLLYQTEQTDTGLMLRRRSNTTKSIKSVPAGTGLISSSVINIREEGQASTAPFNNGTINTWQDAITEVVENGEYDKTHYVELSVITAEMEQWLNNYFAGIRSMGIDFIIQSNTVVIMKEKQS